MVVLVLPERVYARCDSIWGAHQSKCRSVFVIVVASGGLVSVKSRPSMWSVCSRRDGVWWACVVPVKHVRHRGGVCGTSLTENASVVVELVCSWRDAVWWAGRKATFMVDVSVMVGRRLPFASSCLNVPGYVTYGDSFKAWLCHIR